LLVKLLILSIPITATALLFARWEYSRRGKLSLLGSFLLCVETGALSVSGIYRWGRNPQYLGWFLFLLGFALTDWSEWCLAALLVSAIGIHLLILVEEQHLLRQFGDTYRQFCDRVPRYFRLSPHRVPE
jgi:protein-S-isoprenylcysteine O-methyltransferase Ste14